MVLTYKHFNRNRTNHYREALITIILFVSIHSVMPLTYGSATKELEWDAWSNRRNVYNSFNDNNKSMQLVGLFEYNVRNFYVNFLRKNEEATSESLTFLDTIFKSEPELHRNKYTGLFEGKNLIILQLESIDKFLTTKEIMPNLNSLREHSIDFLDHYSFVNGGGSTFNSEFMVNTGYATPYSYNQNAYTFSKNNFDYSLPNLFKSVNYTVKKGIINVNYLLKLNKGSDLYYKNANLGLDDVNRRLVNIIQEELIIKTLDTTLTMV